MWWYLVRGRGELASVSPLISMNFANEYHPAGGPAWLGLVSKRRRYERRDNLMLRALRWGASERRIRRIRTLWNLWSGIRWGCRKQKASLARCSLGAMVRWLTVHHYGSQQVVSEAGKRWDSIRRFGRTLGFRDKMTLPIPRRRCRV